MIPRVAQTPADPGWGPAQTAAVAIAIVGAVASILIAMYSQAKQRKLASELELVKADSLLAIEKFKSDQAARLGAFSENIKWCEEQITEFYRPLLRYRSTSEFLRQLLPGHPWG